MYRQHLWLKYPQTWTQVFLQNPLPEVAISKSKSHSDIVNKEERIADFKINSFARKKPE